MKYLDEYRDGAAARKLARSAGDGPFPPSRRASRRSVAMTAGDIGETSAEGAAVPHPENIQAGFNKVLELGIPFQELDCVREDRIEFLAPDGPLGKPRLEVDRDRGAVANCVGDRISASRLHVALQPLGASIVLP